MTLFNSSLETDSFLATCLARITTGQQRYLKIPVPSLQFRFLLRGFVAYSIRILRYKLSSFLYLEILRLFAGKRRELYTADSPLSM